MALTVEDVNEMVGTVEAHARDGNDEEAHYYQDKVYRQVLREIGNGFESDAATLARAALEVEAIDFARWYA